MEIINKKNKRGSSKYCVNEEHYCVPLWHNNEYNLSTKYCVITINTILFSDEFNILNKLAFRDENGIELYKSKLLHLPYFILLICAEQLMTLP